MIEYRCTMLGLSIPKDIDYTKTIKSASRLGYHENLNVDYDSEEIKFNYTLIDRHITKPASTKSDLLISEINNTGYKGIYISPVNFDKKRKAGFQIVYNNQLYKNKSINIHNKMFYRDVLKKLLKHKCTCEKINFPKDIDYETGEKYIEEFSKANNFNIDKRNQSQYTSNNNSTGYSSLSLFKTSDTILLKVIAKQKNKILWTKASSIKSLEQLLEDAKYFITKRGEFLNYVPISEFDFTKLIARYNELSKTSI
jgi:hypothetical protein